MATMLRHRPPTSIVVSRTLLKLFHLVCLTALLVCVQRVGSQPVEASSQPSMSATSPEARAAANVAIIRNSAGANAWQINAGETTTVNVCCGSNNACANLPTSVTFNPVPNGLFCSTDYTDIPAGSAETTSCLTFVASGVYYQATIGLWQTGAQQVTVTTRCSNNPVADVSATITVLGATGSQTVAVFNQPGPPQFYPRMGSTQAQMGWMMNNAPSYLFNIYSSLVTGTPGTAGLIQLVLPGTFIQYTLRGGQIVTLFRVTQNNLDFSRTGRHGAAVPIDQMSTRQNTVIQISDYDAPRAMLLPCYYLNNRMRVDVTEATYNALIVTYGMLFPSASGNGVEQTWVPIDTMSEIDWGWTMHAKALEPGTQGAWEVDGQASLRDPIQNTEELFSWSRVSSDLPTGFIAQDINYPNDKYARCWCDFNINQQCSPPSQ